MIGKIIAKTIEIILKVILEGDNEESGTGKTSKQVNENINW